MVWNSGKVGDIWTAEFSVELRLRTSWRAEGFFGWNGAKSAKCQGSQRI
jgi:hypothetical protein